MQQKIKTVNSMNKRILELMNTHDKIMEMGFKGLVDFDFAMSLQSEIQGVILKLREKEVRL